MPIMELCSRRSPCSRPPGCRLARYGAVIKDQGVHVLACIDIYIYMDICSSKHTYIAVNRSFNILESTLYCLTTANVLLDNKNDLKNLLTIRILIYAYMLYLYVYIYAVFLLIYVNMYTRLDLCHGVLHHLLPRIHRLRRGV